jgi:hypothetical protein
MVKLSAKTLLYGRSSSKPSADRHCYAVNKGLRDVQIIRTEIFEFKFHFYLSVPSMIEELEDKP